MILTSTLGEKQNKNGKKALRTTEKNTSTPCLYRFNKAIAGN